jgi:hypothetical protein
MQVPRRVIRDTKGAPRRAKMGPARVAGHKNRASVGMTTEGEGNDKSLPEQLGTALVFLQYCAISMRQIDWQLYGRPH